MTTCVHAAGLVFRSARASGNNENGPNCVEVAPFFKAAKSNPSGNCVQVAFTKAEKSYNGNNCVEVGFAKAEKSFQGTSCVEVGEAKSATRSAAAGHCVTVSPTTPADHDEQCTPETCTTPGIQPGDVVVRDSKLGEESPLVVFRGDEWREFVNGVLAGPRTVQADATYTIRDPRTGVVLSYTPDEWDAFLDGCAKGEFTYHPTSVPA